MHALFAIALHYRAATVARGDDANIPVFSGHMVTSDPAMGNDDALRSMGGYQLLAPDKNAVAANTQSRPRTWNVPKMWLRPSRYP